jgi:PPOX class probable F420-dependent enzyme
MGKRSAAGSLHSVSSGQRKIPLSRLETVALLEDAAAARSQAMATIPEKYLDLLEQKKAFASLATTMPDGSPQVTPVWFDYKNGIVRVNTAKGRVKARNLKEGAAVALAIIDPDNPYRYIQLRGHVRRVTEEGAAAHIDSLAKKYLGQDKYTIGQPGEVRLTCEIEPMSASGMG